MAECGGGWGERVILLFSKNKKSPGEGTDGFGQDIYKDWREVHMHGGTERGKVEGTQRGVMGPWRNRNGGAIRDVSLAGEGSMRGTSTPQQPLLLLRTTQLSRLPTPAETRGYIQTELPRGFLRYSNLHKNHSSADLILLSVV